MIASPTSDCRYGAVVREPGPGGGSTYLAAAAMSVLGRATEMLLLGRFIEMEEAQRLGLVTEGGAEGETRGARPRTRAQAGEGANAVAYGAIKNARNPGPRPRTR